MGSLWHGVALNAEGFGLNPGNVQRNSTLSRRLSAVAAFSSVPIVTDGLSGSSSRSSAARLVFIRVAMATFVSRRRFISLAI